MSMRVRCDIVFNQSDGGRMSHIDRSYPHLRLFMALIAGSSLPAAVVAQEYPAKPIRWIVPYATGGSSDFLARLIGQKLTEAWGQAVVVDNRAGANGNIGTEAVAKAAADGYTMLFVASTITINQSLFPSLSFDVERDFAPVTTVLWQPTVLAVHPSLPARSVQELIALARAKPGAIDYSSGAVGNPNDIGAERFAAMAGIKLRHIPYRGLGPAILALLAGEIQLSFASAVAVAPHLTSGRIRVIGVTSRERIATMPDVPTVAEAGLAGYEEGNWQGVLVPARTPRPIIGRLNQEIVRILNMPDVNGQIVRLGASVIANTPDEFAAMIRADLKKYAALIKDLGIRAD
jgi:tripartite-type tricarboxylate transporter receptor subunit TctC